MDAMDACRLADFVVFVLSATDEVDALGDSMLRTIESQGVSNVVTLAQGLDKIEPAKRRPQVLSSLKSFITHFFNAQERVHSLDSRQDASNVVRSLCTTTPKGIRWREDRSWMLIDHLQWPETPQDALVLTGVVRGRGLNPDRLVQVGDWGDFQIDHISPAPLESKKKPRDAMAVDDDTQLQQLLHRPTADQDDLEELAPEELAMEDAQDYPVSMAPTEKKGVLLDDHHYFSDESDVEEQLPKRMPKGTSKYQSAWYQGIGELSDSGSDLETVDGDSDQDMDMEGPAPIPADGLEGMAGREATEYAPSEYPQSEMFLDPSPEDEAEQLAAYRAERKEAEEDLEFPDEIELHPNVSARERLAKYRGLKSLRTSTWETEEDRPYEPQEYSRLLEVGNYKAAKTKMVNEALVGGVKPGTRVAVHLRVSESVSVESLRLLPTPMGLFSLLRHEHKRTACNHTITLNSDYPEPLKSKDTLIMQCGPRRLLINPLFSQAGNTPNNVHKFERYLHPGRSAVATFIAPLVWGSVPCLFFKKTSTIPEQEIDSDNEAAMAALERPGEKPEYTLIATGTSAAPASNRVIAKRAILTGHPYKIHKRVVTVRYMFFNEEDVAWFKALQLWTKRGRSGFIKESLGTHGYFKAQFDGKMNPMDAIGVSMYKRVWPRWARQWVPGQEGPEAEQEEAPELVEMTD